MSLGIIKTFNLDMVPGGAPPIIHVSAEDVGRPYSFNLLYAGEPYDIQGNRLTIAGTKPDGTVFEYDVDDFDRDDSWCDFTIKKQMSIIPGTVRCKLREYLNDDQIGSATFILDVDEYVYDPEAASESYIPTYETAIQEALENVADDIADLATAAAINDVKQYSDAASASATAAAGSATSAQTSAGSATSAAEDAEDSADRAEAAADSMATYNTDRTPYLFRQSGGGVETGDREYDTIVGGTVAWNQLVNISDYSRTSYGVTFTYSGNKVSYSGTSESPNRYIDMFTNASIASALIVGHKYLIAPTDDLFVVVDNPYTDTNAKVGAGNAYIYTPTAQPTYFIGRIAVDSGSSVSATNASINVFDLTQMFGSTIADYIYSLEQATEGAGVAWFRQYFPEDYYEYNAGELKSVSGVSAHVMRDGNDNIIGNYPLDDSLTLRGLPKLDGSKLYYDGDTYESDGTVTRKFAAAQVTYEMLSGLSTSYIGYSASSGAVGGKPSIWVRNLFFDSAAARRTGGIMALCNKFEILYNSTNYISSQNRCAFIVDGTTVNSVETFLSYVQTLENNGDGLYIVYELATLTTETAEPFTNPQVVDPDGTEEYVTDSIVPVGHDTRYRVNLADKLEPIFDVPTTDGTYTLTATVSNGVVTYSWESS